MKLKNNLEYFWMYFKWQIIAVLVVVVLGIHFLSTALSDKECALSIMLLDSYSQVSDEQMEQELLQALQLDENEYIIEVQNSLMLDNTEAGGYAMTSLSRFLADVGSEKLDVCGMLEETYWKYDDSATFMDLKTCLSKDQLQILEKALVYTEDGRAIGLYADKLPGLQKDGCYDSEAERGIIGIVYNTTHQEMAIKYLMYLATVSE